MSGYKIHKQSISTGYIPCTLFVVLFYCNALQAAESSPALSHDNVKWTHLVYEASAFFVTLNSEIKLHVLTAGSMAPDLVFANKNDALTPSSKKVFRIDTRAEGFGKKTEYQLWFDSSGASLQRKKIVRGKKNEIKIYRFSNCGYYSLRKKFPSKKFDENFSDWDESNTSFSAFEPHLCEGQIIYDVNELLYLISAMNIKNVGYRQELLTFSKGRLVKIEVNAKKMTSIYSELQVSSPTGNEKIENDVDVLQVTITPVTSDKKERESFKFLGLKGNIKLYIDTRRQLILRLSGTVDIVGSIDINLKKAELAH